MKKFNILKFSVLFRIFSKSTKFLKTAGQSKNLSENLELVNFKWMGAWKLKSIK